MAYIPNQVVQCPRTFVIFTHHVDDPATNVCDVKVGTLYRDQFFDVEQVFGSKKQHLEDGNRLR